MRKFPTQFAERIEIVDALRGFALLGILLMHSVEHWDFLYHPDHIPAWLKILNRTTFQAVAFLFSGKAYAIFAMMFGLSFYIILNSWTQNGINFRSRFLWPLTILAAIGFFHGIIFTGDILLILAVLGIPLVFLYKLNNRVLIWISVVLMLQIPSVWQVVHILAVPEYQPSQPLHWQIYGQLFDVYANGSFADVCKINLWKGQIARILWTVESGRYLQLLGLFICGILIGRNQIFEDTQRINHFAKRALFFGSVVFAVLYTVKLHLGDWGFKDMHYYVADNLLSMYNNLAQMAIMAGGFVWLYQWVKARNVLNLLAPYGRMSLTCYVAQALIGIPLFYNYGFGLFHYLGAFYSIFAGLAIFMVQILFARYWLKRFEYGPLEWLWRSFTFFTFSIPFRKLILVK